MHPILKVAGVVHIWYYIPLCTIFAQQFNGDVFRTKSHNSKSRSQNPTPILKEDSLTHQSGNQKTIQGSQSPGPAGVGWQFHSGLFQGHSQRLYSLSISCQGIKYFNTPWTTQLVHTGVDQSTCMYLAQSGQFNLPLWKFNNTVHFKDGQDCIGPIQTIQASINQPVCTWPNWANSIFHCGNSITQFIFKMARTVLAQFRQYSR
ncbi:hypothetical protein O181_041996 [Austropuccinia psidii MF-1]|uniref:Uncharacterized protein n=1 Tax=Austropuccinia psidii MF-1 TaxID=1389203 RepID=A0A9Q3DKS3_9BASI|nr:hypothetical protein [Austropuccinia psidii MF-1]